MKISDREDCAQMEASSGSVQDVDQVTEAILKQNATLTRHVEELSKSLQNGKGWKETLKAALGENKKLVKQVECLRKDIQKQTDVKEMYDLERTRIADITKGNRDKVQEIAALQFQLQQIDELKQNLSNVKSERKALEEESVTLQSTLKNLKETAHKEEQRLGLKDKVNQYETLKQQTDALRQNLQDMQKQIQQQEELVKDFPQIIEETSQLEALKIQLEKEISDRKQRQEETRQLTLQYNDQLEALESLQTKTKSLKKERKALGDFLQDPEIVRAELDQIKVKTEVLEKTNVSLQQELANLQQQISNPVNADERMTAAKEEHSNAKKECGLLKEQIKQLKAQIQIPKQEISTYQKDIRDLEKQLKKLKELQADLHSIFQQKSQMEEERRMLEEEVSHLKKQREHLHHVVVDYNEHLDVMEAQRKKITNLEEEKVHLSEMLLQEPALESELNYVKAETSKLIQTGKALNQHVEALTKDFKRVEEMKDHLKKAKKTNESLKAENASLEKTIQDMMQEIPTLERRNGALQKELNEHQSHLQKYNDMKQDFSRIAQEKSFLEDLAKQQEKQILALKQELKKAAELETRYKQQKDLLVSLKKKTENLEIQKARETEMLQILQEPDSESEGIEEETEMVPKKNLELSMEVSALQDQNGRDNLPAATKERLTAKKTTDSHQNKVKDLKAQVQTLTQQTDRFQEEFKDLQKHEQEEEEMRLSYRAMLEEKWDLELHKQELETQVSFLRKRRNKSRDFVLQYEKQEEHLGLLKQETVRLIEEKNTLVQNGT